MTVARYRQRVENVVNCWDEIYGKLFSLGRGKCCQAGPGQLGQVRHREQFTFQLATAEE